MLLGFFLCTFRLYVASVTLILGCSGFITLISFVNAVSHVRSGNSSKIRMTMYEHKFSMALNRFGYLIALQLLKSSVYNLSIYLISVPKLYLKYILDTVY